MTTKKSESLQRALHTAAELFISHRFEDVSMSAIAQAARCSTTTMYQVWGNKERLFMEALSQRQCMLPVPWKRTQESAFQSLLRYTHERIVVLSLPETYAVLCAMLRELHRVGDLLSQSVQRNFEQSDPALRSVLGAAVAEGMLRDLDMDVLTCTVRALTTFQPLLERLAFGHTRFGTPQRVLNCVFQPLVTEKGELTLQRYLAAHPSESANDATLGVETLQAVVY